MGANEILTMGLEAPEPMLTAEGVRFAVSIENTLIPCLITREALHGLARGHGFHLDTMNTFRAFEAKINSVARSQVLRGARQQPLVLEARYFH